MGRLLGPFGVRGWVKVAPFTESSDALLDFPTWWIEGAAGWAEHRVQDARMHGEVIIAQVSGIATREDALLHKGEPIGVPRDELPAPAEGEIYWADLIGLAVRNRRGDTLGIVEDVQDNGAHGLLRVRAAGGGSVRLIPYVPAIVDSVDLDLRRIVVDWEADW
jgi:16S rRNA processing protein RimM